MQTTFTPEQLADPAIADCNVELRACLQCDYCISNCPTYQLLGDEYDSSRGRIFLIKEMLERGGRPEDTTVQRIDRCLSCLACMSTCPSSVHYMHLVDHAREFIEANYRRPLADRLLRWAVAETLTSPRRLRRAMQVARWVKPLAPLMPARLKNMVEFAPDRAPAPSAEDGPRVFPAEGERRYRVALLAGCAQRALDPEIHDATVRVLRRHGCEVVVARGAECCGALTHHMGKTADSRVSAAGAIRAWMHEANGDGLDAIVVNTSGCGTVVKDYWHMFRNHDLAADAATVSSLAKDISELLTDIELDQRIRPDLRVAYHSTCSLQFGQRIRYTPKKLLKKLGLTVLEPRDAHWCCGAAGTYKLLQPEISDRLRERKIGALEAAAPDAIVAGNVGCMMQIRSATSLPVLHTVQLVDWVTGGPLPKALRGLQ